MLVAVLLAPILFAFVGKILFLAAVGVVALVGIVIWAITKIL